MISDSTALMIASIGAPPADQLGDAVHPDGVFVAAVAPLAAAVREADELRDHQADDEEQHRGPDVVAVVDLQRLERPREEEVERQRRHHCRDDAGGSAPFGRGDDHHDDEHERDVDRDDAVGAEGHEQPGDQEWREPSDREAERLLAVVGDVAPFTVLRHGSGIRLNRRRRVDMPSARACKFVRSERPRQEGNKSLGGPSAEA